MWKEGGIGEGDCLINIRSCSIPQLKPVSTVTYHVLTWPHNSYVLTCLLGWRLHPSPSLPATNSCNCRSHRCSHRCKSSRRPRSVRSVGYLNGERIVRFLLVSFVFSKFFRNCFCGFLGSGPVGDDDIWYHRKREFCFLFFIFVFVPLYFSSWV